ncbi:MAG: calcium-binding protein, partial [Allosphingosinicella sp.]
EGTDLVRSTISYVLGANLENMTLLGSAVNGTGNALNNVINGNAANNVLDGGAGNDTLDGGAGNDTTIGGLGNDLHVVRDAGDVVVEAENEGTDQVTSFIDYTLGANFENLALQTGSGAIRGTGNELNNIVQGNANANILSGMAGNDSLNGGNHNDTIVGGTGNDYMYDGNGDA